MSMWLDVLLSAVTYITLFAIIAVAVARVTGSRLRDRRPHANECRPAGEGRGFQRFSDDES
jgi:hypothetical protein